jgi:predicted nucleic acid-binding protein
MRLLRRSGYGGCGMPGDIPRIYWDACVLLSYVEGTPERLPVLEEVLTRAERREIEIVTSTISRVEVAYMGDDEAARVEAEPKIDDLWNYSSPINLVELYDQIADSARDLIRAAKSKELSLGPCDAMHIATAMHSSCTELHTYDKKLPRFSTEAGLPIHEPNNPQERLPSQD